MADKFPAQPSTRKILYIYYNITCDMADTFSNILCTRWVYCWMLIAIYLGSTDTVLLLKLALQDPKNVNHMVKVNEIIIIYN